MMKKHLSVLGLWSRIYLGRTAAILALMVLFETILFAWRLGGVSDPPPALEDLLGGVPLICGAAFVLILCLLCASGWEQAYTLGRLSIPEEAAVLWQALACCACLLLLWAVQTAAAVALCRWYAACLPPAYGSVQTVFLAFYRSDFLHNLLPLDAPLRCVRNGVLVLALGFAPAMWGYKIRQGSRFAWGMTLFLGGMTWTAFQTSAFARVFDILAALTALAAIAVDAAYLRRGRRNAP